MAKKREYTADSIDVNLGLDAVRATPQVYLGNPDSHGIFHITKEGIDNSIDEHIEIGADLIGVTVEADGTIWIFDSGRGIPVEKHKVTKISTLTTVLTTLSAGGKMRGAKDSGYKTSRGVHGMGISITCAMSEELNVWTFRNKKWHTQKFKKGKAVSDIKTVKKVTIPLVKDKDIANRKSGTIISFKPDLTVFDKGSKLVMEELQEFLDLCSYLHPSISFLLTTPKLSKKYKQPKGLAALINKNLSALDDAAKIGKPFIYQNEVVDIALQWAAYDSENLSSFVNGSKTVEGGTHITGMQRAISDALKKFKGKRTGEFKPEDLRTGLISAINIKIPSPRFQSQTKDKLVTPEANELVYNSVVKELESFFNKNKSLAKKIINIAVESRKALAKFSADRKLAAKLNASVKNGKIKMPDKYADAETNDPTKKELYLVEGDSAAGTAKDARDKNYQAVLPLRGKILNVFRDKTGKIGDSQAVVDILTVIGYDHKNKKDPLKKLRVGKIIFLTDQDEDGYHISLLLTFLIQKVAPELFERGIIYTLNEGLFMCQHKSKFYFGESKTDIVKKIGGNTKIDDITVERLKGWGSVDAEKLEPLAFNPESRSLVRVDPLKDDELKDFLAYAQEGTAARKELLNIN